MDDFYPGSCLVVMIHSYNADLFINGEGTGVFAESVKKQVQALVLLLCLPLPLPGFLSFHPYLFFRDVSWGEIPDKMTRRVRSVLIPYIVWNTLYYFLFIVVQGFPSSSSVAGKGIVVFLWKIWRMLLLIILITHFGICSSLYF